MRWRRFRTWAKWACTVAAAVALGLVAFSRVFDCEHVAAVNNGTGVRRVYFSCGLLAVQQDDRTSYAPRVLEKAWMLERSDSWHWGGAEDWERISVGGTFFLGVCYGRDDAGWTFGISIVYPVLLTTIPAALLWYSDRRRFGPGRCVKCGYDLSGLASDATCPECGRALPAPQTH